MALQVILLLEHELTSLISIRTNKNVKTYLEHDRLWNRAVQFLWIPKRVPSVVYHLQHFLRYFSNKRWLWLPNTVIVDIEINLINLSKTIH